MDSFITQHGTTHTGMLKNAMNIMHIFAYPVLGRGALHLKTIVKLADPN